MPVFAWKVLCAALALGSFWFAIVIANNIWKTLRTGSTHYVHPELPRVSRRAQSGNFWLFIALNFILAGFFAAGAVMFGMLFLDVLPVTGLELD